MVNWNNSRLHFRQVSFLEIRQRLILWFLIPGRKNGQMSGNNQMIINEQLITRVSKTMFLGAALDDNLTLKPHIFLLVVLSPYY